MRISAFKEEDARVTFRWNDETVTVHYDRSRYTTQFIEENMDKASEELLAHVVTKWDVYDDQCTQDKWSPDDGGESASPPMYPLEAERLKQLPQGFVALALQSITDAQRPNLIRLSQSTNISSQEE